MTIQSGNKTNIMNHKYNPRSRNCRMGNLLAHAVTSRLKRHEKCKTNPITKLQASSIKNRASKILQNKPNFNQRETRDERPTTKKCKTNPILPTIFHSLLQLFTSQLRTFTQKSQKKRAFCKFLTLTHLTPCTTKTYITFLPQYALHKSSLPDIRLAGKNTKQTQFKNHSEPKAKFQRLNTIDQRLTTINMQNEANLNKYERKYCSKKDLHKFPHPAMLVSTNNQ